MADWPERDLDSGNGLRIGTWNLDRDKPLWRQPHQAEHIMKQAEVWLLTEVPANWQSGTENSSFSGLRPDEDDEYWSAIISRWPVEHVTAKHPSLAMAYINHDGEIFLAACSVFPWRGAAEFWPAGDGDVFAERCANTLDAHAAEICEARCGLPVVWGGDFNRALSGRDFVGSDVGRDALCTAFANLGLRAVTGEAAGQVLPHQSIDHIAIPRVWNSGDVEVQRPEFDGRPLSDHPSYVVSVEPEAVAGPVQSGH
jgi:Endonuclease/Exonuclease/phosphatase family